MDKCSLEEQLHKAVSQNKVAAVHSLLKKGVNASSFCGCWTVLHLAVCAKYEDIVELLIHYGADINAKTKDFKMHAFTQYTASGATPLHVAVDHSTSAIVRMLLFSGCKPNERNQYQALPLDIAAQRCVACLEKYALSSKVFNKSEAILQIANQFNNIRMLLSAGGILSDVTQLKEQAFIQQKFQVYLVYLEQWDILDKLWSSGHSFHTDSKGINVMYVENVGIDKLALQYITDVLTAYNNSQLSLFQLAVNEIRLNLRKNVWCGVQKLADVAELPNCVLKEVMLFSNNDLLATCDKNNTFQYVTYD